MHLPFSAAARRIHLITHATELVALPLYLMKGIEAPKQLQAESY